MFGSILTIIAPLAVFFIKIFIRDKVAQAEAIKNYYASIVKFSGNSVAKVAKALAADVALKKLQKELREKELIEPPRGIVVMEDYKKPYTLPHIIDLDIDVKTNGKYLTLSKKPKGLVIHYTAGRFGNGHQDAITALQTLAKRGLGCLVMDTHGQIYKAKNQALDDIAWHAGTSQYKGLKGMSRYCLGLEICCAGKLNHKGQPWYDTKPIPERETRYAEGRDNQAIGKYHRFTAAQEKSLVNFILWQFDVNPEFSLNFVMGHDECAPGRKTDPGASLSMTMPEFRAMISRMI